MATIRIYLEQWGTFWSYTPKNFLMMAGRYIKTGKPFNLSEYGKQLSNPPSRHVFRYKDDSRWSSSTPGTYLYHVTDWDERDYSEAFKEIYSVMRKQDKRRK